MESALGMRTSLEQAQPRQSVSRGPWNGRLIGVDVPRAAR